jgi:hypothetical protein
MSGWCSNFGVGGNADNGSDGHQGCVRNPNKKPILLGMPNTICKYSFKRVFTNFFKEPFKEVFKKTSEKVEKVEKVKVEKVEKVEKVFNFDKSVGFFLSKYVDMFGTRMYDLPCDWYYNISKNPNITMKYIR